MRSSWCQPEQHKKRNLQEEDSSRRRILLARPDQNSRRKSAPQLPSWQGGLSARPDSRSPPPPRPAPPRSRPAAAGARAARAGRRGGAPARLRAPPRNSESARRLIQRTRGGMLMWGFGEGPSSRIAALASRAPRSESSSASPSRSRHATCGGGARRGGGVQAQALHREETHIATTAQKLWQDHQQQPQQHCHHQPKLRDEMPAELVFDLDVGLLWGDLGRVGRQRQRDRFLQRVDCRQPTGQPEPPPPPRPISRPVAPLKCEHGTHIHTRQ